MLIIAVIAINYGRFFAYAGYELNKNYIAAKLCENKSRPWLHCNGKCYLMKKIKQAEEKQSNDGRQTQKNLFQEACFNSPAAILFTAHLIQTLNTPYREATPHLWSNKVIHPPQLS